MNSDDSLKPYNIVSEADNTLRNKTKAALEAIAAGAQIADLNLSADVKREIDRLVRIAMLKYGVPSGRRPRMRPKKK